MGAGALNAIRFMLFVLYVCFCVGKIDGRYGAEALYDSVFDKDMQMQIFMHSITAQSNCINKYNVYRYYSY